MRKAHFVYIMLAFTLASCIKPPTYPNVPIIQFVSVSSSNATNGYSDTITFSFTDGNGNIGVNTNSTDTVCNVCGMQHGDSSCLQLPAFNVFLIDSRDTCVETFASANIQPSGKYKAISGTVEVITAMSNTKCFGGCPCAINDTVTYAIILKDLSGNLSNTIHTTPIVVLSCQ